MDVTFLNFVLAAAVVGLAISGVALGRDVSSVKACATLLALLCDLRALLLPVSVPVFWFLDFAVMLVLVYAYRSLLPLLGFVRLLDMPLLSLFPVFTVVCTVLNLRSPRRQVKRSLSYLCSTYI